MWGLLAFGLARLLDSRKGSRNGLLASFRHDFLETFDGIRIVLFMAGMGEREEWEATGRAGETVASSCASAPGNNPLGSALIQHARPGSRPIPALMSATPEKGGLGSKPCTQR